jgi:beta-glucanase (GH16 family)
MILNVAMGGTFGGTIDPAFTQSSMEIDYVRIYQ